MLADVSQEEKLTWWQTLCNIFGDVMLGPQVMIDWLFNGHWNGNKL